MKEYTRENLTVVWDKDKCIHSAKCVNGLGSVFKPKERPWIQLENAELEEIKNQVNQCPSGALSYRMEGEIETNTPMNTNCEVIENGPLLVHGSIEVKLPDGSVEQKERSTAFCRCGASSNKPYCDGTHNKTGFEG